MLRENESQTVNLIINANPQPTTSIWRRNGQTVTSGNGLILADDSFTVDPANKELAGTYTLEAINSAGPAYFEIMLDVQCKMWHYLRLCDDPDRTAWPATCIAKLLSCTVLSTCLDHVIVTCSAIHVHIIHLYSVCSCAYLLLYTTTMQWYMYRVVVVIAIA